MYQPHMTNIPCTHSLGLSDEMCAVCAITAAFYRALQTRLPSTSGDRFPLAAIDRVLATYPDKRPQHWWTINWESAHRWNS